MRTLIAILVLLVQSLVSASTLTCTYDSAGRLVNVNYGGSTNTTSSFDNNGNLLSQSTFVSANPDLTIVQSATPAPVVVGTLLEYTVSIFNDSSVSASTVKLTNTLPANVTLVSNAVTLGSVVHSGNNLAWSITRLTNATGATLTFTVRPGVTGALTNKAIVKSSLADPYAPDNTNTLVTAVVAPPAATAAVVAGGFLISWPIAGGDNFSVQYADSLSPPVTWTPLAVEPSVSGDSFIVEDSLTNSHRFYRLVSP